MSDAPPNDWLGLHQRTCVVTGAGGGIGRAIAVSFAKAGANVVLVERNAASAADTAHAVAAVSDRDPLVITADVSVAASVELAAQVCSRTTGGCDILVNNAALLRPGPLESLSLDEWNALLAVNLNGYFLCSQIFGRAMRTKGKGAIVHIASISGAHPQGFSGAYSVSKAGVVMLSKQIATEWGDARIRSNVVSPGMVETPMSESFYAVEGVRERRSAVIPQGRIGTPQDMADAVLFLASDRASYISGQEITVDGGYSGMLMNLVPRPGYDQSK